MATVWCREITNRNGSKDAEQQKRYVRTFQVLTSSPTALHSANNVGVPYCRNNSFVATSGTVQSSVLAFRDAGHNTAAVVNPAAHEEYLLGRFLLWKFIEEDRERAVDHFNRATQIDPGYAAPYAGLAHAWWMRGVLGPLSLKQVGPPARAAAR